MGSLSIWAALQNAINNITTNLGDKLDTLNASISALDADTVKLSDLSFAYEAPVFVAAGPDLINDISSKPVKTWALMVLGVGGAATAWHVTLEGNLTGGINDGWTEILHHSDTDNANGQTVFTGDSLRPFLFYRINCDSLTLGGATGLRAIIAARN